MNNRYIKSNKDLYRAIRSILEDYKIYALEKSNKNVRNKEIIEIKILTFQKEVKEIKLLVDRNKIQSTNFDKFHIIEKKLKDVSYKNLEEVIKQVMKNK